jgi:hypothetical protein
LQGALEGGELSCSFSNALFAASYCFLSLGLLRVFAQPISQRD